MSGQASVSQPRFDTSKLLEQADAILDEEDAEERFFTPSKKSALSSPQGSQAFSHKKTCSGRPSGASGKDFAASSSSHTTPSKGKSGYPNKWTKGHDEALIIFSTSLALLYRQHLHKMPFFEPWSGYGWSHLSTHLRKAMRNSLRDQGCSFELPNLSKGTSGGGALPDEVVRAMESAILRGSAGGGSTPLRTPVTPRRRPINSATPRSAQSKRSFNKRLREAGASTSLQSEEEEEELSGLDSTASSAGLRTPPPPRAKRPRRTSAGGGPAGFLLKGLDSSNDDNDEEDLRDPEGKKRRRRRSTSTDSALDELWTPRTPTVDRSSRRTALKQMQMQMQIQTPRSARPCARPVVKTPTSPAPPPANALEQCESQRSIKVEPMCIDLTLSDDD